MAFTCRLSAQALGEIEKIKEAEEFKTNSKALEHVLQNYRTQSLQLESVEGELRNLKKVIANKVRADRECEAVLSGLIPL